MIKPYLSDVSELREAFSGFPSGIVALAALVDGEPVVLVASSFTVGISQDPPLVLFAVQKSSTTWPQLSTAQSIGVSVLGEDHSVKTRQLAAKDKSSRLDGINTRATHRGAVFLESAPIWLECSVEHSYPAGDHQIIVLRVLGIKSDFQHNPLIWYRSSFTTLSLVE